MKTDTYTKVVLTVIAVCLVVLVFRDVPLVSRANAAGDQVLEVDVVRVNGRTLAGASALPVEVRDLQARSPLPVSLHDAREPLQVDVRQLGGRTLYGGPLPVNIEQVSGSSVSSGIPVHSR